MTRMIAAVFALSLLADAAAGAAEQARFRRGSDQPTTTGGRIGGSASTRSSGDRPTSDPVDTPSTDSRSTARLTVAPRAHEASRVPFPFQMGLGWAAFGFIPAWPVNGMGFPAAQFRPLEGAPTGGVQLDMNPRGAQVYVDGSYVGVVSDFSGYYQHLELGAGSHLLTIVAPGHEPLTLQVIVSPGRTTTHRGSLTRVY